MYIVIFLFHYTLERADDSSLSLSLSLSGAHICSLFSDTACFSRVCGHPTARNWISCGTVMWSLVPLRVCWALMEKGTRGRLQMLLTFVFVEQYFIDMHFCHIGKLLRNLMKEALWRSRPIIEGVTLVR